MKKGDIYEGTVEKISFANKGLVMVGEEEVTVRNAIPGQKVRFLINKKRKGKVEGRILEVLEASPLETCKKACSLFPECGGCTYQTMDHDEQIKMKLTQVRELLIPSVEESEADASIIENTLASINSSDIVKSPEAFEYRNKMEFSFGDDVKDGPLTLGLHRKNSMHDVLNVTDCAIVSPDINVIVRCTRDYFDGKYDYYHTMSHEGYLRNLLVRRSIYTNEILVAIVTTSQAKCDMKLYKDELLKLELDGTISGILHITNDSLADVVKSDKTEILYGKDYFYERLLGLDFKITPFSFFQTNSKGAEKLYSVVRDMIGDVSGATVFDLYSGTGTIAQILSPAAKKVIGVEIVEEAVEAAKENTALNKIENCEFLCGDVLQVIDEIDEKPDFLILDPPRDGIHPKAMDKLIAYGVERFVYVSCKPTSLARDLKEFLKAGYKVDKMTCVDMFPHTVHVETICLLSIGDVPSVL